VAINPDVFDVVMRNSLLIAQTLVISRQNVLIVQKIIQPTTMAVQFTKNFNAGKYAAQQVILYMMTIDLSLKMYKVATFLIILYLVNHHL